MEYSGKYIYSTYIHTKFFWVYEYMYMCMYVCVYTCVYACEKISWKYMTVKQGLSKF